MKKIEPRNIHIYLADESRIDQKLDAIIKLLMASRGREIAMVQELDAVEAAAAKIETVAGSVGVVLDGLTAKINELVSNATDLASLKAGITKVTGGLESSHDSIIASIVKNTAAEDEEPPVEEPPVE